MNKSDNQPVMISVIMPVYNSERYLERAVRSVLDQTFKQFELICVNDGSTDKSPEILQEFADGDSRVIILHQQNKYAGAARNNGIKIAKGVYYCFLDSDDVFEPTMLEKAYNCANKEQADIVVWSGKYFRNNVENGIHHEALLYNNMIPKGDCFENRPYIEYVCNFTTPAPWNKLFKKELIEENQLRFQECKRFNDAFFVVNALVRARKIGVVREDLVNYRTDSSNSLQNTNAETPLLCINVFRDIKRRLEEDGIYNYIENSFRQLALSNFIYSLDSVKTKDAFIEVYKELKYKAFEEFGIIGTNEEQYYWQYPFHRYERIMSKEPEQYLNMKKLENAPLYSFDIFDTLITRKTATPYGIFAIMEYELRNNSYYSDIPPYIRENFYNLRISSEKKSNMLGNRMGREESTLESIYSVMMSTGEITETQAEVLAELERKTEIENVIGINDNIQKFLQLKREGRRVVLVSDMYLDKDTIRKMLVKVNKEFSDVDIYLSSEIGKTKRSGHIYYYVKNKEEIDFKKWVHYGDNECADYKLPKQFGITPIKCASKTLIPIEEHIIGHYESDITAQLIIGASANARLFVDKDKNLNNTPFKLGTTLLSPFLCGYLQWVISNAVTRGIKKLYFIARDGYILKQLTDKLIEITNTDIETAYIYGSREAWRLAGMGETFWDIPTFFQYSDDGDYSIEGIAKRFKLTQDELMPFIKDCTDEASYDGCVRIGETLQDSAEFKAFLMLKEQNNRNIVKEYLEQNINFNEKFAFVEFIGSGYTQKALTGFLYDILPRPTLSYFYRLDGNLADVRCEMLSYAPGFMQNKIIECLLTAPHGRTIGYSKGKSKEVSPVIDDENKHLDAYGMEQFRIGFERFVAELENPTPCNLKFEKEFMDYICNSDDQEIMDFIGEIPFNNTGRNNSLVKYAPKLTTEDIFNIYILRNGEHIKYYYNGMDLKFSVRRTGINIDEKVEELKREIPESVVFRKRLAIWYGEGENWSKMNGYRNLFALTGEYVVIYGAGKIGKEIASYFLADRKKKVLWVDKAYDRYALEGYSEYVKDVSELKGESFDTLIIAVKNKKLIEEIVRELNSIGISREKILLYEDFLRN